MNKTTLVLLTGVVVVGGVGYFALQNSKNSAPAETKMEVSPSPEAITSPSSETGAMPAEAAKEFTVEGSKFSFSVKEIKVKKGDKVRVTFTNKDGVHDWRLDEFSAATKQIEAGQSEIVEFTANQAGTFEYYCSVGQHRKNGMAGKLIVEE